MPGAGAATGQVHSRELCTTCTQSSDRDGVGAMTNVSRDPKLPLRDTLTEQNIA